MQDPPVEFFVRVACVFHTPPLLDIASIGLKIISVGFNYTSTVGTPLYVLPTYIVEFKINTVKICREIESAVYKLVINCRKSHDKFSLDTRLYYSSRVCGTKRTSRFKPRRQSSLRLCSLMESVAAAVRHGVRKFSFRIIYSLTYRSSVHEFSGGAHYFPIFCGASSIMYAASLFSRVQRRISVKHYLRLCSHVA